MRRLSPSRDERAAELGDQPDCDGGLELAELLTQHDGRRVASQRAELDSGTVDPDGDGIEAAVAARRPDELAERAPGRLLVDQHGGSGALDLLVLLDLRRGGAHELERVDLRRGVGVYRPSSILVTSASSSSRSPICCRGGLDHLDVARRRIGELDAPEGLREAVNGRERRPEVVAGERHEAGEAVGRQGGATLAA